MGRSHGETGEIVPAGRQGDGVRRERMEDGRAEAGRPKAGGEEDRGSGYGGIEDKRERADKAEAGRNGETALKTALLKVLNADLDRIICSNPRNREHFVRLLVRPMILKGGLRFQVEEFTETQAFQRNLEREEAAAYVAEQIGTLYRNAEAVSRTHFLNVLVSKKGRITVKSRERKREEPAASGTESRKREPGLPKIRQKALTGTEAPQISDAGLLSKRPAALAHDRTKNYLLREGIVVPFLVDLGVMTPEGKVVKAKYDKFRQINRFLEFIEEVLPELSKERLNTILDFGCGKSYLTFAMYYYLKEVKGYPIRVVGLDLKKDVIALCSRLSEKFGFGNLQFCYGDIAGYEGVDQVDMVVTLHACDTATDFAMAKAVRWGARVILSVPCCQHELDRQLENELLSPVLQYGLIRERMAALLTDGIRAQLLEAAGYRTQILEFIDMEHTPKNIMIRAVRRGKKRDGTELEEMMKALHAEPMLYRLLKEAGVV